MFAALQPFLIGLLITAAFTPLVIRVAWRMKWIARPRTDRHHQLPTALMGGIAIFAGAMVAWMTDSDLVRDGAILSAGACMFLFGVVDDVIFEFKPRHKLLGQVAVAAGMVAAGVSFHGLPQVMAVPLSLLWIVGITNAVNLLDNMDGLAAGISAISAVSLAAYSASAGDLNTAMMALALAGACSGFLFYNFHPARIFMGDCGSMFIGTSLAALALRAGETASGGPLLSLLVPVTALAIPIFDTALVAVCRKLNGRPVLPGARDHSSHRLSAIGLSDRATAGVLYSLAIPFGALAVSVRWLPLPVVIYLALLMFGLLLLLGLYLGFFRMYGEQACPPDEIQRLGAATRGRRRALQVLTDVLVILTAFAGACLIRYDGAFPRMEAGQIGVIVGVLVVFKVGCLFAARAYRGLWRHAGIVDVLTVLGGSTLSLCALVALQFGTTLFQQLRPSVLLVDWMLCTLLLSLTRTSYVALREVFGMFPPASGPRVIILGTGLEARVLTQELRDPLSSERAAVVGIVGEEPEMKGRSLNGVPVLGVVSELPRMLNETGATRCVLGVSPQSRAGRAFAAFCREHQIPLPEASGIQLSLTPREALPYTQPIGASGTVGGGAS